MNDNTFLNISEKDFSYAYRSSIKELISRMPSDWSAISKHNADWHQNKFDAEKYLIDSEIRFRKAFNVFSKNNCSELLDVGGFLAAFPLTMAKLGFTVSVAEKFDYYGNSLDNIANCLIDNNIEIIDCDFTSFTESEKNLCNKEYDGISCMAVAEHLAHTPKHLMDNIYNATAQSGHLVFEVPNLAFWPNRFSLFFRGRTIHAPIESVYHSATPFTGHHREYTIEDARYVLNQGGFAIENEEFFNYALNNLGLWSQLYLLPARLFSKCAGIILIHAIKK